MKNNESMNMWKVGSYCNQVDDHHIYKWIYNEYTKTDRGKKKSDREDEIDGR